VRVVDESEAGVGIGMGRSTTSDEPDVSDVSTSRKRLKMLIRGGDLLGRIRRRHGLVWVWRWPETA
jgi:hypothetical protein